VCFLLCNFTSIWFKICNPIAEAANKNEKITKDVEEMIKWEIVKYFSVMSVLFTYMFLFGVGFGNY
jgi:hypothetical protein